MPVTELYYQILVQVGALKKSLPKESEIPESGILKFFC